MKVTVRITNSNKYLPLRIKTHFRRVDLLCGITLSGSNETYVMSGNSSEKPLACSSLTDPVPRRSVNSLLSTMARCGAGQKKVQFKRDGGVPESSNFAPHPLGLLPSDVQGSRSPGPVGVVTGSINTQHMDLLTG